MEGINKEKGVIERERERYRARERDGKETLIQLADLKSYFIKIPLMLMMMNTAIFTANEPTGLS